MRLAKPPLPIALLAFMIMIASCVTAFAQDPQPPQNLPTAATDPIEQLHLMPEQRQKIRAIRESQREERALINQRLREANIALEQALDADNPDDALIEQRVRDAAAAQAASMRMRILTEVKIRRVLTQEQLTTLRQLRLQARELTRDQNQNQRPARQGNVLRPNQRNGLAPIFPRRDGVQRNPRP
jgi:Spy/CpxP family protein refolding chaperone